MYVMIRAKLIPAPIACTARKGRTVAKHILIIDDEAPIADMLEQVLLEEGYSARKTTQSLRFYDEVREFHPDLILLDLMMPFLDGTDQLRLMGLTEETREIPVIMVTGSPHARDHQEEYLALGVRKVLLKPVNLQTILELIRATIGGPEEA